MLELIVISTLNGVLFGMLLFLLSSGLTVIFSMMGVLNFAHASFYMLGAFFGFQLTKWIGFWPALVLAPLLVGAIGMAVERYGLRNTHKHGHVAELLLTFGLAFAIEEIVSMIWGKSPVDYRVPTLLDFPAGQSVESPAQVQNDIESVFEFVAIVVIGLHGVLGDELHLRFGRGGLGRRHADRHARCARRADSVQRR